MSKTKTNSYLLVQRLLALAALMVLIAVSVAQRSAAQTVTQGYDADQQLQRGIIVKLKDDDSTKIEPVTNDTLKKMHGVVVDANDAPVTLSADGQKVFVATTGHFDVLVTDQNGPINAGDYIGISALPGIGMKATDDQPVVVGKALASYDGKSNMVSRVEIKDGSGATRSLVIGRVQTDIGISSNPLLRATDSNLPSFLKKATETLVGKEVSAARVYLGLGIFLATGLIAGSILYAGVRSSITAIGRNPLSKKSITKSLIQVILTSLIIFITGLFGVYLLLKL